MLRDAPVFLEFFAGGGLARLGLEAAGWSCALANDHDAGKAAAYRAIFPDGPWVDGDVWNLDPAVLAAATHNSPADLAWASFPCQDLSLAGARAGLGGARSSAFHGFWCAMEGLAARDLRPRLIVLENVVGLLTSHGGADFAAITQLLVEAGYLVGGLVLDAAAFTPQSRPRVFVIAAQPALLARTSATRLASLHANPSDFGVSAGLITAQKHLPDAVRAQWAWWRLPPPPARNTDLIDVLEDTPPWWPAERTHALTALMNASHREKLRAAQAARHRIAGAVYRRVRVENGRRVQRAEARFDGLAGCLRTPAGGSSRQFVILTQDGDIRARALTPREYARLMGVDDGILLPKPDGAALKMLGDGVAVPVVRWLTEHLLTPLAAPHLATPQRKRARAMT